MEFDLDAIQKEIDLGYVKRERHPKYPISIYNYTNKTQSSWRWNEITTKTRGLVLDDDGKVVAKGLDKFLHPRTGSRNP